MESAALETLVYGSGKLTFDWAVSCEEGYDWLDFWVDGELRAIITGDQDWTAVTIAIDGAGKHTVRWEYWKDDMDEDGASGANLARLDHVAWTPDKGTPDYTQTTDQPMPFAAIRTDYPAYWRAAKGDYETAAQSLGANGRPLWESWLIGLDPDDATATDFKAKIEMVDGKPVITWEPDLNENNAKEVRRYTIKGSSDLKLWDAVPGAVSYKICRDFASSSEDGFIGTTDTCSYLDEDALYEQGVWYSVFAVGPDGQESYASWTEGMRMKHVVNIDHDSYR